MTPRINGGKRYMVNNYRSLIAYMRPQMKKSLVGEEQRVCVTCGRTDSPEWRKVSVGVFWTLMPLSSFGVLRALMAQRPCVMLVAYVGPNARGRRSLIRVHRVQKAMIVASQVHARLIGPQ